MKGFVKCIVSVLAIFGGVKYILICADESVEVNGVSINIKED